MEGSVVLWCHLYEDRSEEFLLGLCTRNICNNFENFKLLCIKANVIEHKILVTPNTKKHIAKFVAKF